MIAENLLSGFSECSVTCRHLNLDINLDVLSLFVLSSVVHCDRGLAMEIKVVDHENT